MDCSEVRTLFRDRDEGRLSPSDLALFDAHVGACARCTALVDEERVVTDLLRTRLPKHVASDALKARLASQVAASQKLSGGARPIAWLRVVGGPVLAVAIAACLVFFARNANFLGGEGEASPFVNEAVNDHLRVLYSARPIEIESGGIHQVKPWFSGRIDFAPVVGFDGDEDFVLQGGAVGYFVDRKVATFIYKRRLHTISMFVIASQGLSLPKGETRAMGRARAHVSSLRGFHVVSFQRDDLDYALVSDIDPSELLRLGARVAGAE